MIAELESEYAGLVLARFDETEALALGQILLDLAHGKPVVIDIRSANRSLFHAALPGSSPLNDLWARRKSNTALMFQLPSMLVGEKNRAKGDSLALHGISLADYADHGGAVPIRVAGTGVVAVATVSGLPSIEDHRLVVAALRVLMQRQ
jgi:uncharacterized protein (UPF0303 family)